MFGGSRKFSEINVSYIPIPLENRGINNPVVINSIVTAFLHKIFANLFHVAHIIKAPRVQELHHKSLGSAITGRDSEPRSLEARVSCASREQRAYVASSSTSWRTARRVKSPARNYASALPPRRHPRIALSCTRRRSKKRFTEEKKPSILG